MIDVVGVVVVVVWCWLVGAAAAVVVVVVVVVVVEVIVARKYLLLESLPLGTCVPPTSGTHFNIKCVPLCGKTMRAGGGSFVVVDLFGLLALLFAWLAWDFRNMAAFSAGRRGTFATRVYF